jgi:hypothetical protein
VSASADAARLLKSGKIPVNILADLFAELPSAPAELLLGPRACHLDLVQWATKPAQGELPRDVWDRLVEQDRDFLRWQLGNGNVRVLLLNGASAVRWLQEAGLVRGFEENVLTYQAVNGSGRLRVFQAIAEGVLLLGWNRPLAGALSADGRLRLSAWLGEALRQHSSDAQVVERATRIREEGAMSVAIDLVNGFVPENTVINGALELQQVLAHWEEASEQSTVGEVGAFGGSPVITVRMRADEFVLNRDTKRAAVRAFLTAAAQAGAGHLRWHVTANARGTANRVTYRSDDDATPGWYAYVRGPSQARDLE